MKSTKPTNVLTAFNNKVYQRAKHSDCGYITLKHALATIVCDFDEANEIFKDFKMPLREFADTYLPKNSKDVITTDPVPSIDQSVITRSFVGMSDDMVTELHIFQSVITTICRRPNSEVYELLNKHVCEPEVLLENVSSMLDHKPQALKLDAVENSVAKPIGLSSVIDRIDVLKNSNLGFFIEINAKSRCGKTALIDYLAQRYFKESSNVFHSVGIKSENLSNLKSDKSEKIIIIDDLDQKSDAFQRIKKHAFKKGTTIISSTTNNLDTTQLNKCYPENHIIISIDNYTENDSISIIDKCSDGNGDVVFKIANGLGYTAIGEQIRISELAIELQKSKPAADFSTCVKDAITHIYENNQKDVFNLMASFGDLEEKVKKEIFGQDLAIDKICNSIKSSLLGFKTNEARPNGIFALVGASGVGKTQTARVIAKELGYECLVLNMGEYHSSSHINKLIGAAAGYVGFDKGNGILYDAIAKNKKTIIVLDEIEKADPKIADLFLSCFDSGTINTSSGIEVQFNETIFFLTSNAGVSVDSSPIGLTKRSNAKTTTFDIDEFKDHFRAEFVNRLTDIIEFANLEKEALLSITEFSIEKIVANASLKLGYDISVSPKVAQTILDRCNESEQGARPIERLVESIIGNKVANYIIANRSIAKPIKIDVKNEMVIVGQ